MKKPISLRPELAAYALSALLHATLLVFVPALLNRADGPVMSTVVVELLEKPEGEADTTLQATPAGEREKPTPPGEAGEERADEKPHRAAEKGRAAQVSADPAAKRPPLKKNTEPLAMESVPERKFDLGEESEEVPDPVLGKVTEATLKLSDADKRYQGFLGAVRQAVNRQWRSRDAMLSAQRSGAVTLGFTLMPSGGRAARVQVVGSSDSKVLDDEAERAVRAASFPPFPAHWRLEKVHLTGKFVYAFDSGE